MRNGERGSITIFFVILAAVLAGVTAYSLYIGRMVDQKMRVETSADAAALSMANHAAMGLNMMAANNLAIAGNLHIAAAVPMIARYYAIIRAAAANETDLLDAAMVASGDDLPVGRAGYDPDRSPFAAAYDWIKPAPAFFMQTAGGLTMINRKLGMLWLKGGFIKGLEQLRLNTPGAVGVPMQVANLNGEAGDAATFYNFRYRHLAQTAMQPTMCHTISSSQGLGETRNSVAFWLEGAAVSFDPSLKSLLDPLRTVETTLHGLVDAVNRVLDGAAVVLLPAVATCWATFDQVGPCQQAEAWWSAATSGDLIPIPTFDSCGLKLSGDYGAQMQAFAGSGATSPLDVGFVFPDVSTETLAEYEESLQFAALVGNPQYDEKEAPPGKCPDGWSAPSPSGREVCALPLGSLGAMAKGSTWARTQWGLGQAKAEYEPSPEDDDPMAADTAHSSPDRKEAIAGLRRFQLFWPAWRGRSMPLTVSQTVLGWLGLK